MKKISKKAFRNLLTSVACNLIFAINHHLIDDEVWISSIWQEIARTALLDYPQNDLAFWFNTDNYLTDLVISFKY